MEFEIDLKLKVSIKDLETNVNEIAKIFEKFSDFGELKWTD